MSNRSNHGFLNKAVACPIYVLGLESRKGNKDEIGDKEASKEEANICNLLS